MDSKVYTWTVRGRDMFPFDMLRYDYCWPASEQDSGKIEKSTRRGANTLTQDINLKSLSPEPTIGRWESFGWSVL